MSVAIAVVLWLIVVNIDNPTGTNYYTLNDVELINKEYVESSDTIGKMCMPEQNQDSIKVAITATKKIRDKIKVTDISAVADLQQAVSLDTNPVMVPITVTCSVPGVSPSDIKVTPQNLSVNLDEKETQEFVVNVSRGDTKPGKDYEVGSLTASPEKVRITGPKTLINKIDKVNASIELDGNTEDFTQVVELIVAFCLLLDVLVQQRAPVHDDASTVGMGAMPRSISASRALGTIQGPPMVASALPSRKRVFTVEYSVSPGMRATNFRW